MHYDNADVGFACFSFFLTQSVTDTEATISSISLDDIQVSIFVIVEMRLLMFFPYLHRKAVKATLVLLPLLGITYMLFFVNPGEDDISQIVFIYFNSFLQSFQVRKRLIMQCSGGRQLETHTQCAKLACE